MCEVADNVQAAHRSERNAAAYRREKARSEKGGKVRTSDRTPQGWLTLLVPNEYLSGSEIPTNQLKWLVAETTTVVFPIDCIGKSTTQ
jgi:hypothetical protein